MPINTIGLTMTSDQVQQVRDSRNIKYEIIDPLPVFCYDDKNYDIDKIGLRGQSALRFERKNFKIRLHDDFDFFYNAGESIRFEEFNLIAMTKDYTYIENAISYGLLKEVNVFPLFYDFVELKFNENSQGLYLLIEDPEYYAIDLYGSEFIMRRGYNNSIDNFDYRSQGSGRSVDYYLKRYNSIYDVILHFEHGELYDTLSSLIDIEQYMQKMAIDYILANGDYTDEVYLYGSNNRESGGRFRIIPWDYDDVFNDKPHEIGSGWGIGTLFGDRSYASVQEVIDEIGENPIYSIEDDLDYTIARDSFLYSKYLEELEVVLDAVDEAYIYNLFEEVKQKLLPFYARAEIIEQSVYDDKPTNKSRLLSNLNDKRSLLIKRRNKLASFTEK